VAAGPSAAEFRSLIAAGVAAPSADNRHVVRFKPSGSALHLCVDAAAMCDLPHHRVSFHEMSFGAVIENICIAAAASGFAVTVVPDDAWRTSGAVATVHFSASPDMRAHPLADAILARHTNRRLYSRRRIGDAILDEIAASAQAHPGTRVRWLDDAASRRTALTAIRLAESERFRRRELHAELFSSIRFDSGWKQSADEGLAPGSLEVEPFLRGPFALLRRWPVQKALNAAGAASLLGLRAGWLPARSAPHLGVLLVDSDCQRPWLAAGRALQRLWLTAARNGVALQPMAAAIALVAQQAGSGWARQSVQAHLVDLIGSLAGERTAVMLVRAGYARSPSVVAGRQPLDAYLV